MKPATARKLAGLADEIEKTQVELDRLYTERGRAWATARVEGATAVELAVPSRVKPISVRQYLIRQGVRDEETAG